MRALLICLALTACGQSGHDKAVAEARQLIEEIRFESQRRAVEDARLISELEALIDAQCAAMPDVDRRASGCH